EGTDVVTRRSHLQEEAAERTKRQQRRQAEISNDDQQSEHLANQPEVRQRHMQRLHPDQLREIDVDERHELVRVPVFVWTEEVPVRAAQERSGDDEERPEHEEAVEENPELTLPLAERV